MAENSWPKSDGDVFYGSESNYQAGNFTIAEAGETIAIGNVVYIKESDGKVYVSDSSTAVYANGVAISAGNSGDDVYYIRAGKYAESSAFTANEVYYLGSSGALTTSEGNIKMGTAYDTNNLYVDIEDNSANIIAIMGV
jgi:hypothetical protein|tara:strand:- start:6 stop:422 length:417 start_codon:yes stop_codon:yes gene_type:complete